MIGRALAVALIAFAGPAIADEVVSEHPSKVTATLYQSDGNFPPVALINETRPVSLAAGDNVVRFDDVASSVIPQTAQVSGLAVIPRESDFDYNLFDPATVLRHSLGRPAELILSPPKAAEIHRIGTLVSDQGVISLQDEQGVEALGCGGPPARLLVDIPDGLRSKPSLSVHLHADRAGPATLHLSYLAGQLMWWAAYVARIAPDQQHLSLEASIVLNNNTETSFNEVPTRFVAGDVSRLWATAAPAMRATPLHRDCWSLGRTSDPVFDRRDGPMSGVMLGGPPIGFPNSAAAPVAGSARNVVLETLGDLKLYRLEEPIRIAAHQQKQFTFQTFPMVRGKPFFIVPIITDPPATQGAARSAWHLRNDKDSGLGKPLPRGEFTVYSADNTFLGNDIVSTDIAEGGGLTILGSALGEVLYEHRVIGAHHVPVRQSRDHALTLENTTARPVAVEVQLPRSRVVGITSGLPGAVTEPDHFAWTTTLAPHQRRELAFTTDDNF